MINPMPIPANFSFNQVQMPDGNMAVVLVAQRWSGTEVYFMTPADSLAIGKEFVKYGEAGNVLLPPDSAPANTLLGPNGQAIPINAEPPVVENSTNAQPDIEANWEASEPAPKMNRQQRRQAARNLAREIVNNG